MPDLSNAVPAKDLKEWHSPSSRTEAIDTLIHGVERYNPTLLPMMEDYLREQIEQGEQDFMANLAVLKLYQFNPQLSNPVIIINILTQALSSTIHGPDFNLCLSLLREPADIVRDLDGEEDDGGLEIVMPWLQSLHSQVRTCQFTAFWKEFNSSSEGANLFRDQYLPKHPQLVPILRHLFSTSIASCFSKVNLTHLQKWLNLPEGEVKQWCESVGWTVEEGVAVVPKNGDNDVKAGVVKENVELSRKLLFIVSFKWNQADVEELTKLVATAAY